MPRNASEIVVDTLHAWGVTTIFGYAGDGINGVVEALRHRQDNLISERANLLQKNEQVRARVEAMIGRLKSMEHSA